VTSLAEPAASSEGTTSDSAAASAPPAFPAATQKLAAAVAGSFVELVG